LIEYDRRGKARMTDPGKGTVQNDLREFITVVEKRGELAAVNRK
jgi:hypothetical protein